jgi:putative DNA primase/helicase
MAASKTPLNRTIAEAARKLAAEADPPKPPAAYLNKAVDVIFATLRVADGGRNNALNKAAFAIGQMVGAGWLDEADIESDLRRVGGELGLEFQEIPKTVRSGLDAGKLEPRSWPSTEFPQLAFKCTDLGNAERLCARHGSELRWCEELGWLGWDGQRWITGEVQAQRLAVETVRSIYKEARDAVDSDQRKRLGEWAARSEAAPRVAALLSLARWQPPIYVAATDLDADPTLLNVANGTIDLRTGELREHQQEDLCTKLAPVEYDPDAESALWGQFLEQATAGQPGLAEFLCRAVGYTLTGSVQEDRVFVLHGPGGAGKTTFAGTVRAMLGDYAGSVRIEALTDRGGSGGHNEDVAVLAGRRLVLAVEASESDRLREGLLKTLTGDDQVPASRKFKPVFFFTPQFKLWLATNHVPRVRSDDSGVWRRLLKLPFLNVPTTPKANLRRQLRSAMHQRAVLAWAVRGCLEWQRDGLQPPESVLAATSDLRRSMDDLAEFFEDRCEFGPELRATSQEVRDAYATWAVAQGVPLRFQVAPNQLAAALRERGCEERRDNKRRGWWGVRLRRWGQ